jgi:very-short-patch-repair endonuclease
MSWAAVARSQCGVIARRQLREVGLSDGVIRGLVSSGALESQARGVYLARGAPLTYAARLWVALLATGGVLGFGTAAHLWGLAEVRPPSCAVIVPATRRVSTPFGTRVHRVFVPQSAIQRRDGMPITTRTWTVLDQLGELPYADACRLADRALQRSWLRPIDLQRRLSELPGRKGNAQMRQIAARTRDGAAAESERVLHRLLRQAGLTEWVANYPLWVAGELIAVVDVAVVSRRIAIEVDGWAHHSDVDRFQRDRHRQNSLTGLGWTVLRFTWADLTQRPGYVIATIRGQLARAS